MKALIFHQSGEPADVLRYADLPEPVAGDGYVLVEVAARPIHPADLAFIRGQYRVKPSFPQAAGLEGSGVIVKSPERSPFIVGTRVAFRAPGSWAEVARVPFDRLITVPPGIPDKVACQVSLNPATAVGLLDEVKAKRGDWVMLTAATSTVSNLVVSIARRRGIGVIGLIRGDAAEGKMRSIADHVLSIKNPELVATVTALTGGRRVSGLLDSVGGPDTAKLFAALAPGACIVAYGVQDRQPAPVTNAMLIYSNLTWKGFGIDYWLSRCPADSKVKMFDELWSMIEDKTLPLPIASTFGLDRFGEALAADAQQGRAGKVLLVS